MKKRKKERRASDQLAALIAEQGKDRKQDRERSGDVRMVKTRRGWKLKAV
jgi:hypothetical protein